jgi:hypothetical protein
MPEQLIPQRHVMDWPLNLVAHKKKLRSLINSCADDEKVIPIPPF